MSEKYIVFLLLPLISLSFLTHVYSHVHTHRFPLEACQLPQIHLSKYIIQSAEHYAVVMLMSS